MNNLLQMTDYLEQSGRTAAVLDEPRRDVFKTDADLMKDAMMLAIAGQLGDTLKRTLFYKEATEKTQARVTKAGHEHALLLEEVTNVINEHPERKLSPDKIDLLHAACGLISEAGEIVEAIVKSFVNDLPLDITNIREELGDTLWYVALGLRAADSTFEAEAFKNIAKLSIRYPEKFTTEAALNRDLQAEKTAL